MKFLNHPVTATFALLALLFAAYAGVEALHQRTEARLQLADAYREGCLPGPGETARITSDGRTAQCRIYSTASLTRGMAPRLVSAAAVEVRQP